MDHIWVLHNPLAGRPDSAGEVDRAAEALARRGVNVRLERPAAVAGLRQAAREAVAAHADAVFLAGGDGSLGAVAAELAGTPVTLGFLPVGTANVWAQELRLPQPSLFRPEALARTALTLLESQSRLMDCGLCNGRLFLLWAGMGLDALVTRRLAAHRPLSRRLGVLYNTLAAFALGLDWRGAPMRVKVDERETAGHYLLAAVSNVRQYASLFTLSPGARLDDGIMETWLFAGHWYGDALAHVARLRAGRHAAHPQVMCLTGRAVEIYTPAPQPVQSDGEPHDPSERMTVQVLPRALRVLIPRQAPEGLFGKDVTAQASA